MGGRKRGSRVFVRLGVWIALLLGLVGCGGEAVAARRLQHEAPKLVKRYIVRELNRRIRENQGGGLVFLAPDSQSLLIAGEAGRHFRMLPGPCGELREFEFARNYIAAHLQYEIAEIVFGRLQSFPDGDNAFSADLTVRLVLRETLWENVPGYPLYGAVLAGSVSPEALETRCRTEYDALLPPPELDYAAIRNSPGRVTVRQLDAVLPADYDPSLPGWRLRDAGGERDDRIQAPSAVRFDLEDWRLPAGLRRRGDKCYFKSGAELRHKYDDHLVWRQGEWRDRADVEASERLEKAFRQWLRSGEITPDGCAALLTAAEQSARARNRDAVMSRVAGRLTTHCRELAEKDRLRELENWNRILRSGGVWRLLPETAAAEAEAQAAAAEAERIANEPKICPVCGARTKGVVCEYCSSPLK